MGDTDYPPCTVKCSYLLGCDKQCGQPNTEMHQSYARHLCKDHRG